MNYRRLCELLSSCYDKDVWKANIDYFKKSDLTYGDYLNLTFWLCAEQKTISENNFRMILFNLAYKSQITRDDENKDIIVLPSYYNVKLKKNVACNRSYNLSMIGNEINKKYQKLIFNITL